MPLVVHRNSYLFVAGLDVCIVLLSMALTIITTRRSQKAIEKVVNVAPYISLACFASQHA